MFPAFLLIWLRTLLSGIVIKGKKGDGMKLTIEYADNRMEQLFVDDVQEGKQCLKYLIYPYFMV